MAEEATEPRKKKGRGKIIVLFAIVLLFIGGGFFAISLKGPHGKKQVQKVVLAEKDVDLEEFLTNTSNNSMYVRTKISVRLAKDFEESKLKDNMADVRDAVILVLNSTAPSDIMDATKRKDLRHRLADAMNEALASVLDKPALPKPKAVLPDGSDSDTGPIYQVRFSALATQ